MSVKPAHWNFLAGRRSRAVAWTFAAWPRQLEPLGPRIHGTISDGAFRHAAEPGQEPAAGVLRRDQMSLDVHSDAGNGAGVCGRVEDAGRERGA